MNTFSKEFDVKGIDFLRKQDINTLLAMIVIENITTNQALQMILDNLRGHDIEEAKH